MGLLLVALLSIVSRAIWLDIPDRPILGDEVSYVNVARGILGIPLPPGTNRLFTYHAGYDANTVHPPLGKMILAGSIKVLGDTPLGWRLPSLLFGSASILALYWLVRCAKGSPWLALGAAALLAVDNLFIVLGRIGTIEILVLPFMLAGTALYLRRLPVLAGVVLGIGSCVKLVGAFPLLVIVFVEALNWARDRFATASTAEPEESEARGSEDLASEESPPEELPTKRPVVIAALTGPIRVLLLCGVATVVTYLALLALLDSQVSRFTNPITHTAHMIGFHRDYQPTLRQGTTAKSGYFLIQSSKPWEWLTNREKLPFFFMREPDGRESISFTGAMNPLIIWQLVPALLWSCYSAVKHRSSTAVLSIAWFLGTFLPFLVVAKDVGYLYYMIVVLPGICLAVADFIRSPLLPRSMVALFLVVMMVAAWQLYPFHLGRI